MHSQPNRTLIKTTRLSRVTGDTPPTIRMLASTHAAFTRARTFAGRLAKSANLATFFALSNTNTHAGLCAGVFFGRLNRRFGVMPNRRFSGPSAEFISVNESQERSRVLQFAPMNNPYRQVQYSTRASWRTGFFNPGT